MGWITTGTVNLVNGSNVVTGVGSKFLEDARIGDGFRGPNGALYEITNIPTNTSLTLRPNYEGATVNAAPYFLVPIEGYVKDSADQLRTATGQIALIPGGKQDKNDNLTAFAGLTGAADRLPYFTGAGALSLATLTAKARLFNARTDTAGMQAELGLVPVTSPTDTTPGRLLTVGYGGLGYADNAPFSGTGLNPDNFRTGQFSIFGQFALGAEWGTLTGWLSVFPGDANTLSQTFVTADTNRWTIQRVQSSGTWSDWFQPFARSLSKGAFNVNNLPPGSNWSVVGWDSQAASNNWPVIAAGNASTPVWWNISTQGTPNRTTQIATQVFFGNSVTFIRSKHDAAWSPWLEVYTTGNVMRDPQAGGILSTASIGGWRLAKYRNGMFICSRAHPNFTMGANGSTRSDFPLPITTASAQECSVIVTAIPEATDDWYGVTAKRVDTPTSGYFRVRNGATPQQLQNINITVTGFWN